MPSCPFSAVCRYSDFTPIEKKIDQIKKKSKFLPFEIKPSTIGPIAGDGLFSTANLKANTIVGIYTGQVGTHIDSDSRSNSLFELGWFKRKSAWVPLVVDGNFSNDGTRFVNGKKFSEQKETNMKAIIGVYRG